MVENICYNTKEQEKGLLRNTNLVIPGRASDQQSNSRNNNIENTLNAMQENFKRIQNLNFTKNKPTESPKKMPPNQNQIKQCIPVLNNKLLQDSQANRSVSSNNHGITVQDMGNKYLPNYKNLNKKSNLTGTLIDDSSFTMNEKSPSYYNDSKMNTMTRNTNDRYTFDGIITQQKNSIIYQENNNTSMTPAQCQILEQYEQDIKKLRAEVTRQKIVESQKYKLEEDLKTVKDVHVHMESAITDLKNRAKLTDHLKNECINLTAENNMLKNRVEHQEKQQVESNTRLKPQNNESLGYSNINIRKSSGSAKNKIFENIPHIAKNLNTNIGQVSSRRNLNTNHCRTESYDNIANESNEGLRQLNSKIQSNTLNIKNTQSSTLTQHSRKRNEIQKIETPIDQDDINQRTIESVNLNNTQNDSIGSIIAGNTPANRINNPFTSNNLNNSIRNSITSIKSPKTQVGLIKQMIPPNKFQGQQKNSTYIESRRHQEESPNTLFQGHLKKDIYNTITDKSYNGQILNQNSIQNTNPTHRFIEGDHFNNRSYSQGGRVSYPANKNNLNLGVLQKQTSNIHKISSRNFHENKDANFNGHFRQTGISNVHYAN